VAEQNPENPDTGGSQTAAQGIRDLIERTFLFGVGAAALTKERVEGLVDEFVHRGQLTGDEGRELATKLFAKSKAEAESAMKKADVSLQGTYRELGLATRRELEEVDFRLRQLEHRLRLLEAASDAIGSDGPVEGEL
jgi:polyhydroxyalkanoate synthesis regulator phasin